IGLAQVWIRGEQLKVGAVGVDDGDRAFVDRKGNLPTVGRPIQVRRVAVDMRDLAQAVSVGPDGEDLGTVVGWGLEGNAAIPARTGGAGARSKRRGQQRSSDKRQRPRTAAG